jgi:hypothetical protein
MGGKLLGESGSKGARRCRHSFEPSTAPLGLGETEKTPRPASRLTRSSRRAALQPLSHSQAAPRTPLLSPWRFLTIGVASASVKA